MSVIKDSDLVNNNGNTALFRPMSALRLIGWKIFNPFRSIAKSTMCMPGLDVMETRRLAVTCCNGGIGAFISIARFLPLSIGIASFLGFMGQKEFNMINLIGGILVVTPMISALVVMAQHVVCRDNGINNVIPIGCVNTGHSDIDALSSMDVVELEYCLHRSGWSREDMSKLGYVIRNIYNAGLSDYVTATPNKDAQELLSKALACASAENLAPSVTGVMPAPKSMSMEPYALLTHMGIKLDTVPGSTPVPHVMVSNHPQTEANLAEWPI